MSATDEGWEELALPDLIRRLQNVVRPGVVYEVDYAKARIKVKLGKEWISNWIPWGTARAGKNKDWCPPEIGEQVFILSPGGDTSRAVAITSIFSDENPGNANSGDIYRKTFENGTVIEYDRAGNSLKAVLKSGGTATIEATGGITLKGDVTIQGNVTTSGDVRLNGDMLAQGEVTTLRAGAPINLSTHIHTGVTPGPGVTAVPQPGS